MFFSHVRKYFAAAPKDERRDLPANSSGHDQTSEFRAFILENVRPMDDEGPTRVRLEHSSANSSEINNMVA